MAKYEHVPFLVTPASCFVPFPSIDIDYSSQVLQNDKSVLSVPCLPNQCGLPHSSAHSMEMSPLEKNLHYKCGRVTQADQYFCRRAGGRKEGRGGVLGSRLLSARVTQRLQGKSRHRGRRFLPRTLWLSSAEVPAATRAAITWHGGRRERG